MNEFQQSYPQQQGFIPMNMGMQPQQLAPQGFLGGLFGGPVGGLIGKGIGGLFGSPAIGSQIGQLAGGIGGALLPFSAGPLTVAAAMPQAPAAMQAMLGQWPQHPLGAWQNSVMGNTGFAPWGGMMPFSVDPVTAAHAQRVQQALQSQLVPQGFFGNLLGQVGQPLGNLIGGAFGNQQLGGAIGSLAGQLGGMLPFSVDPVTAAYAQRIQQAQQSQLAPQGFFGNLLGQVGQPLGNFIGGAFGNQQLGGTIGALAGQLGGMLPFSVDPITAAYVQRVQQAQQSQLAPQGFFGNLLGQVGQPLGNLIGGAFGNQQLGGTIGALAGQLGGILPFSNAPYAGIGYPQQAMQQGGAYGAQQAGSAAGGMSSQPTIH